MVEGASVMSTIQCRGTGGVKTDAKNDATAQKRGTFLHHERKIQNGFQAVSYLEIWELQFWI